ncbi:semaphorin-3E [Saimiri boliviensis]|uniref:Semaphorin 3E n=2 Tax=Saimiri boliviensis boliviensis TaxID=39432 RepID=A0A2K6RYA2_SAIBB|nr:semaphorin-3E [Saimiri boliviensis boliviensis]XP_010343159.1 semaphorin-3E [Saimiri boliviensis boliviensis]XP_010343165.1 semaphorin-3E [Saimiri boliviensis boliviensis]
MASAGHIITLLLWGYLLELWTGGHTADTTHPRLRLSHKELLNLNRTAIFHSPFGFLDLHTMLLDEYQERLFVGGKDLVYSLSLEKISDGYKEIHWPNTALKIEECMMKGKDVGECANYVRVLHHYNKTHLLTCSTGGFEPLCAFIRVGYHLEEPLFHLESTISERGRGKCPYDSSSSFVSTLIGTELFTGLYSDYWIRDASIFRSMGRLSHIRTEHDDERLLNEPKFVGSYMIPDNEDRDDNKVYFFFTEKALEAEDNAHTIYARVGRLCVNDIGGQRILVNKWSTFLKARLVCSVPGTNRIDTYFDELEDVFLLPTRDHKNPVIFGLFNTTSNVFRGHAICVYHMSSIRAVFNGPYAHKEGPEYHWSVYEGKVPYPRPGSCASTVNGGGYRTTRDYPDDTIRFARNHPLMYQAIKPAHKKPILVKTDGKYNLKQIAVDRVEAEDGQYDVLFIGTDNGIVLKVITIYNQEMESMEEVILEELQIFKDPVPIISMEISSKRQQLYIGSASAVAQVRFHHCDMYGSACADCCLARDPYCAWDGISCSRYYPTSTHAKRRFRRQDVRHGNAAQQCFGQQFVGDALDKTEEHLAYGIENNSSLLECTPRSLQAKVIWFVQKGHETRKEEVKTDDRVIKMDLGLLFLRLQKSDAGTYFCQTVEHSFVHTARKITLEVVEEEKVEDMFHKDDEDRPRRMPCPAQSSASQGAKPWYKEFLQLIGYSNFQRVEEYCEKVWCTDRKRKKLKMSPSKWKYANPQEKKLRSKPERYRLPRHTLDS